MVGWLADEIMLNLEIFKISYVHMYIQPYILDEIFDFLLFNKSSFKIPIFLKNILAHIYIGYKFYIY